MSRATDRVKDLFSFKAASNRQPDTNEIDSKLASISFTGTSGMNGKVEKARAFEDPTYYNVINNTKFPNTILPEVLILGVCRVNFHCSGSFQSKSHREPQQEGYYSS